MCDRVRRDRLFRLFVGAVFGLGTLWMSAGSYAADAIAYHLGTGDKIHVTVYEEKELTGDYDVNDQGEIALPLIGPVKIAGKTITEAEALITQRYGKDYLVHPRVNVQVLNYRPFFILGEVKSPGSYPYINGMTVVNAIALAGGYTVRASSNNILIKRGADPGAGEQRVKEDSAVLPGDVIRVPERYF